MRKINKKRKNTMNIEEAKKMEGTEFTYIYEDSDTIPAYVKKFDPEIGLTCFTLATETAQGWKPADKIEEDGTWCVIGVNVATHGIKRAFSWLEEIRDTGCAISEGVNGFGDFLGCAF